MPDMLELVWLDPKRVASFRTRPSWRRLLDEARRTASEGDLVAPLLPGQDVPEDDRRDTFLLLARAESSGFDAVSAAVASAVREDGKFVPPLQLVTGMLRLPFDELEALKAGVTVATPFTGGDEPLQAAVGGARTFLETPGLLAAPAVAEALLGRIREAFGRTRRAVAPGYFDAQLDRALLENRSYQKRTFAGKPHLRALLEPAGAGDKSGMLVYLPAGIALHLPLYQRFLARVVVAAHFSIDQFEPHPFALEALALARQVPRG